MINKLENKIDSLTHENSALKEQLEVIYGKEYTKKPNRSIIEKLGDKK